MDSLLVVCKNDMIPVQFRMHTNTVRNQDKEDAPVVDSDSPDFVDEDIAVFTHNIPADQIHAVLESFSRTGGGQMKAQGKPGWVAKVRLKNKQY